jgi:hypothetical protein
MNLNVEQTPKLHQFFLTKIMHRIRSFQFQLLLELPTLQISLLLSTQVKKRHELNPQPIKKQNYGNCAHTPPPQNNVLHAPF